MPAFVYRGDLDTSVTLSPATIGHVVSLSDEVNKVDVLAPNPEDLFAKELCDLLVSLEVACPGYGKEIACLLMENDSRDKIKKVEKSLWSKSKKNDATWKACAAA